MSAETYSTEGPICPECGHQHRADDPVYFDERTTVLDCDHCERDFAVEVYIQTSWTCKPRDGADQ